MKPQPTAPAVPLHDFTSAHYLGFHHPSRALPAWSQLSTGRPTALRPDPRLSTLEQDIASLVGTQAACVGTSSLHLFTDLIGGLSASRHVLLLDAGCYPIASWAAERARGRGVRVSRFRHFDADALAGQLKPLQAGRRRPIIVTDGLCTECGRIAPLPDYVALAHRYGGVVVVDDTQAVGLLGRRDGICRPYGNGGGGSLRWHGLAGNPRCLIIASLAKTFAAPLAALCATDELANHFRRQSQTALHCSPPSTPTLLAARHALALNDAIGNRQRHRLALSIRTLRRGLASLGLTVRGGFLPIQCIHGLSPATALRLHAYLTAHGISTLLRQPAANSGHWTNGIELCAVLTAAQGSGTIEALLLQIHRFLAHRTRPDAPRSELGGSRH